jgi:2-phosphoglycerate kinase
MKLTTVGRQFPCAVIPGGARNDRDTMSTDLGEAPSWSGRVLAERDAETAGGAALRDRLRHVCWIGGGSGAGKSTIARRVAARHGLRVYATDDAMADHARRSSPEDCPLLHRFMAMDMDERWVSRPPRAMLETFHWFRGEGFDMIVEDLLRLPREPGVIVEGFRLLPRLVEPLLSVPGRAVWLLPTPDFRRGVVERRGGSASGFLAKTTDPERALINLLERDRMFTDLLREETGRLALPAIEVDATMSEDDLAERVTEVLGLRVASVAPSRRTEPA